MGDQRHWELELTPELRRGPPPDTSTRLFAASNTPQTLGHPLLWAGAGGTSRTPWGTCRQAGQ